MRWLALFSSMLLAACAEPTTAVLCAPATAPATPTAPCTSALVDGWVCPAGPGSGYGYVCQASGCWLQMADGPCAAGFGLPDGGQGCSGEPCSAPGATLCQGRWLMQCSSLGCLVPIDVCAADGG